MMAKLSRGPGVEPPGYTNNQCATPMTTVPDLEDPFHHRESWTQTIERWAKALKKQCVVLVLVMKHKDTPWYAKLLGGLTLLYALSPIDLIPDFIPVLGYLDDLLIVPIGIWLTTKLVPDHVWVECELEAQNHSKPAKDWRGVILVAFMWLLILTPFLFWFKDYYAEDSPNPNSGTVQNSPMGFTDIPIST